jgi:hypothetical protein
MTDSTHDDNAPGEKPTGGTNTQNTTPVEENPSDTVSGGAPEEPTEDSK